MNTNMTGFISISKNLRSRALGKSSLSIRRVKTSRMRTKSPLDSHKQDGSAAIQMF